MKLEELKERIVETLGLEVATSKSLITSVNNCLADLLSRGYREFVETDITPTSVTPPYEIELPANFRRMNYVKVETEENSYTAYRISLASEAYRGKKDDDGNIRIAFPEESNPCLYYILHGKLILDTRFEDKITKVTLGYQAKLNKIPHNADLDYDIPIREDIEDALVLYGVYFYVNRSGFDPEVTKEYMNRYRYYVEDILNALNAEDTYQTSNGAIDMRSIF